MEKKAIEIRDLSFSYPGGAQALSGISLDVYERECVAVIGPNGAGKSTLLLHLNGLLGNGQEIKIFGQSIKKESLRQIRQKVGLVFQDPNDQLFMPTVYEDAAFGPQNLGWDKQKIIRSCESALKKAEIFEKKDFLSHHLSLGEQRRASIATVLSMAPQIMVLDEPNSNLDPAARRHLINLLKGLEITKIIATHDLEMVLDLSSRVFLLDKGRLAAQGKTRDILSDKTLLESHGLEVPLSLS